METAPRTELKRDLGPWAAASIVVGTVIGSGIFLVPKTMIQKVGTVEAVFAVWVVGGLLSLAGALSYAELAAALPEAGGEYAFLREAYGPLWGFLYSWTQMWVAKSGSIATLATGFFLYLTTFFEPLKGVILHRSPAHRARRRSARNPIRAIIRHCPDSLPGLAELFRRESRRQCSGGRHLPQSGADCRHHPGGFGFSAKPHAPDSRVGRARSPSPASSPPWWLRCGPTTAGTMSAWCPRKSKIRKKTCRAH